jgi:hypothetical protein
MYAGPSNDPYMSNIPPWRVFVQELARRGLHQQAELILEHLAR